jgi:glycyl-tRNA synthetase beta chain
MSDFLLEIFSEEIPAKMQKAAAENFLQIATEVLAKNNLNLAADQIKTFITPRRLVLYIYRLDEFQISPATKRVGPKLTADKKAIEGFLRSAGLKSESELEQIDGAYVFNKPESKIKTAEILKNSIPQILNKMVNAWPKLMRFDVEGLGVQPKWIRPIRNIACMFGSEIIDVEFAGLKSNKFTFGRSFEPKEITNAAHFEEILEDDFIILNHEKRKDKMIAEIRKIKFDLELDLIDDVEKSSLFDELVGLCEWPTALVASIDAKFLDLPDEVLILTLRSNQKYLCLKKKDGALATQFIFISNAVINENNRTKIIADNEKVVRARLWDAEFFMHEDIKVPLISRVDDLKKIVFHQKLGSLFEKKDRLNSLTKFLSIFIPHCELSLAERASDLCKVDLTTKAVGELPELQGKIGSFYALQQKEDKKIVAAIYEHYLPIGQASELPQTPLGIALSIADKIDSIVGFFLADEKPTSSKDPYALRRAALGIIRISFQHNIAFPIRNLIEKSLNSYPPKLQKELFGENFAKSKKDLIEEIIKFFIERLKGYLKDNEKVNSDVINVVMNEYLSNLDSHKTIDILYLTKKIKFLDNFVKSSTDKNLIALYKRAANILAIEERKDGRKYDMKPSRLALRTKYEVVLNSRIKQVLKDFSKLITKGEFETAFKLLHVLEAPLTHFFDNVVVNDADKGARENRLLLLSQIRGLFNQVGDLSKIEIS